MSKASKWRSCPALSRDISPADCGEQRQSRLACPVDCPHNPFAPANYSQLLEMENRLAAKSADQLIALTPDQATFKQEMTAAERRGIDAINVFFTWRLFFAKGTDQLTIAQRWGKDGWTGLKNDERVLLRGKMQMRVALLEVHRVLDGGRVEAVDLLSPEPVPIILQDSNLAGIVARFSTFLSWLFPLPHYWRLSGTAAIIPELAQFSALEIVREIVRHHGGPLAELEMRLWLAEHFMRFGDTLQAVSRLRRRQTFASMDAKLGKAVYELRATFAQCRQWLDTVPDVEPGTLFDEEKNEGFVEARDWLDGPPEIKQLATPGGQMVLGGCCWDSRSGGLKRVAGKNSPGCGCNLNSIWVNVSGSAPSGWMIWVRVLPPGYLSWMNRSCRRACWKILTALSWEPPASRRLPAFR